MAINQTNTQDTDGFENKSGSQESNSNVHKHIESNDVGADDAPGGGKKAIGTDGTNDEKADNTPELARKVRENDDSVGEE